MVWLSSHLLCPRAAIAQMSQKKRKLLGEGSPPSALPELVFPFCLQQPCPARATASAMAPALLWNSYPFCHGTHISPQIMALLFGGDPRG